MSKRELWVAREQLDEMVTPLREPELDGGHEVWMGSPRASPVMEPEPEGQERYLWFHQ